MLGERLQSVHLTNSGILMLLDMILSHNELLNTVYFIWKDRKAVKYVQ